MADSDRYVLVCDTCKDEIAVTEYTDAGWGSTLNDDGNAVQLCPKHFARCNGCGRKRQDTTVVAYLIDRSKKKGLCKSCKERVEKEDMDSYTRDALSKLCDIANGGNIKDLAASMFRSINRQHRYLQNEFFSALCFFFELYGAQDENHCDARNKWAVAAAKQWHKDSLKITLNAS